MQAHALAVDITDSQRQGLAQTQPHAKTDQDEGLVAQLTSAVDQALDLTQGQHIRQGLDHRRLDDIDPLPVALQDMLEEELQAIAVDLHGGPTVGFDQGIEIAFELLAVEIIDGAIEKLTDATHGAGIDIDGGVGFAQTAQCANMLLVQ